MVLHFLIPSSPAGLGSILPLLSVLFLLTPPNCMVQSIFSVASEKLEGFPLLHAAQWCSLVEWRINALCWMREAGWW